MSRSLGETGEVDLVRIGVHAINAPIDAWETMRRGLRTDAFNAMCQAAKQHNVDPTKWRVTFEPVPASLWVRIQQMVPTDGDCKLEGKYRWENLTK